MSLPASTRFIASVEGDGLIRPAFLPFPAHVGQPVPDPKPIRSIAGFMDAIQQSGLAQSQHSHVRVWYRGQSDASWGLRPGIYRHEIDELVRELAKGNKTPEEDERLTLECHLTQDFQVEAAGLLSGRETRAELYFLEQHYGLPTRLLDWTHSPLAALYFAIENRNAHGAVFIMDAYNLAPSQRKEPDFRGVATSRHGWFVSEMKAIFEWEKKHAPLDFIMPVRPDHSDRRVSRQHSCFTFHSRTHKELGEEHTRTLKKFIISKDSKGDIRDELTALGVNPFVIYGDLPSLAKRLKKAYNIPDLEGG